MNFRIMTAAQLYSLLLLLSVQFLCGSTQDSERTLMFCKSSKHVAYGSSESGTVVSPKNLSSSCQLQITACKFCRLQLNFTGLRNSGFLSQCSASTDSMDPNNCLTGCNHMVLYEPGLESRTFTLLTSTYSPVIYLSNVREVVLHYCRGSSNDTVTRDFSFTYQVLEKEVTRYHGLSSVADDSSQIAGTFRNLGFPNGYTSSGDLFVYNIRNDAANGHVRLVFVDWELSEFCNLIIYDGGNRTVSNVILSVDGSQPRPFVISNSNELTIDFVPAANVDRYIGFQAAYYFVSSSHWNTTPDVVGQKYFTSDYSDSFNVGQLCKFGERIDYVWVMDHSEMIPNGYTLHMLLHQRLATGDLLEIHRGNNSNGDLVPYQERTKFYAESGFYVRAQMTCSPQSSLDALFFWMRAAPGTGCMAESEFHCINDQICIPINLACDGILQCDDGSDEANCAGSSVPTGGRQSTTLMGCLERFRCRKFSSETICKSQRCDGTPDCVDMTDELSCDNDQQHIRNYITLSVVVPVVLVIAVVTLAICAVVAFALRTRRRLAALRRTRIRNQHQAALRAAGNYDDCVPSGWMDQFRGSLLAAEEPPSYDDTVELPNLRFGGSIVRPPSYQSTTNETGAVKYTVGQTDEPYVVPPAYPSADHQVAQQSSAGTNGTQPLSDDLSQPNNCQ